MERGGDLRAGSYASVAACVTPAVAKESRAEITWSVDLKAPPEAKHVRLWIPYPMTDIVAALVEATKVVSV